MIKRYLPVIIDHNGKEYTNMKYEHLSDAMDALKEFIEIFKNANDNKIVDAYVLNTITRKIIRL